MNVSIFSAYGWKTPIHTKHVFTTRRQAKHGICRRRGSVSVCLCLSVTLQHCIKMAKRRIMQIMQHDSPGTPVF